jgi:tetratricopeptide (TPR) repeat protein
MSSTNLDLSLPDAPRSRGRGGALAIVTCLASLAAVVLLALLVLRGGDDNGAASDESASERSPDHLRAVAQDLEKHTLYAEAARSWGEYLAIAEISDEERAKTLYRRGVCLQKAGRAEEAAALFTEIEILKPTRQRRRDAQQRLLECLSSLGKEEVRRYVLSEATVKVNTGPSPVIARIGDEAVTIEELRRELVDQMTAQMARFGGAGDHASMARQISSMVDKQLASEDSLKKILEQVILGRVLYREALSRGLGSGPEFERALASYRRAYLSQKLVESEQRELVEAITDADLKNHYEAQKSSYVEPESVSFSYLALPNEDAAKAAAATITAGGDAATQLTKGFVQAQGPATAGEPLPGLGRSSEAFAQLVVIDEGAVATTPVKIGESWYLLRSDGKTPSRQLTQEEASERVRTDLATAKRAEAMSRLQTRLQQKFEVEVFSKVLEETSKKAATDATKTSEAAPESEGDAKD